jgi:hypothetical protein
MEIPDSKRIGVGSNDKLSFLSKNELLCIRKDISQIIVPCWVTKLSSSLGERSNGKLKADEWRSLFSIYLPITCFRLWADKPEKIIHLKALLILSIIVNIVSSTTSSRAAAVLYDNAIRLYLELIVTLYPKEPLVVTHHLALHLSRYMRFYGPCRSHWAFPFERLIGKLQKIPHNSHTGNFSPIYLRYESEQ